MNKYYARTKTKQEMIDEFGENWRTDAYKDLENVDFPTDSKYKFFLGKTFTNPDIIYRLLNGEFVEDIPIQDLGGDFIMEEYLKIFSRNDRFWSIHPVEVIIIPMEEYEASLKEDLKQINPDILTRIRQSLKTLNLCDTD